MTVDGELASLRAVARQLRSPQPPDARRLGAWANALDSAARGIGRSVSFLRAEAAGKLPRDANVDGYDGLTVAELLAQVAVRSQELTGDDEALGVELNAARDALYALGAAQKPRRGRARVLANPDADGPGAVRSEGSQTSRAAAERVMPKTGSQRRKILDAVASVARDPRTVGLTDVELARFTNLPANSVRPRRVELVRGGWLEPAEHTREHHGGQHTVWVLTTRAAAEGALWEAPRRA